MTLSPQAVTALIDLEHGATMNCIHTVARELIREGMAFEGWGKLEITEMGRRSARTFRSFTADSTDIAELHLETNRGGETFELAPEQPVLKENIPHQADPHLPWSRERAMKAAGVANGADTLVPAAWIATFMDAYETL
jgi:hypothetical protein